jgi:hypothetical protein
MYFGENIHERCALILKPLLKDNDLRLTEQNFDMVNDIIVGYLKYLLEQKCQLPSLPAETFSQKMLSMIRYMIEN